MFSPRLVARIAFASYAIFVSCSLAAAAEWVTYDGEFSDAKESSLLVRFQLNCLLDQKEDSNGESQTIFWTLQQQGEHGFAWVQRFGEWKIAKGTASVGPALLIQRPSGSSVVKLSPVIALPPEAFHAGQSWIEGKLEHRVTELATRNGVASVKLVVGNAFGQKQEFWAERDRGLIYQLKERVFIGQGEEHQLRLTLAKNEPVTSEQAAALQSVAMGLLEVRSRLKVEADDGEVVWTDERLEVAKTELPPVLERAKQTPLAKFVQAAIEETRLAKDRAGAVASMRERIVGGSAPRPAMRTLQGNSFDWLATDNKVVVLHLWDYRETPLEEPYGQVAYVDFLMRNRPSEDVVVYGVAVDERFRDAETARRAATSVRKFVSFMNLSYPMLVDDGSALRQFGDPRASGQHLPLFVVIGKDGKVLHYHAGHYEVNRDQGLDVLTGVVREAVK